MRTPRRRRQAATRHEFDDRPRLRSHLAVASEVLVLATPGISAESVRRLNLTSATQTIDITDPVPHGHQYDAVVLAVQDLVALRRLVAGVPHLGSARRVAVWFDRAIPRLPTVIPAPHWPALETVVASRSRERFVLLSFESDVTVRDVLVQVARAASPSGNLAVGWPAIGAPQREPALWPVADPSATVASLPRLLDPSDDSPPDLLVLDHLPLEATKLTEADHHVLGRPPRVILNEPDPTWEALSSSTPAEFANIVATLSPTSFGAIDEQLVNPIGFTRRPVHQVANLAAEHGDSFTLTAHDGSALFGLDADGGLSETDLPALRQLAGIQLDWSGGVGPVSYCRLVAGLAMAGVPMVSARLPEWAEKLLAPELVEALERPADLSDPLRREEHSVRLRRAALRFHATRPWRRRMARIHGLQEMPHPKVSLLLVTKRPEMLPFALRQLARQKEVEFEVVLATHGFDAAPHVLEAFGEVCPVPLVTLSADRSESFGEVLNRAAAHASGDLLLKMDDDDWYGPHFVEDLLLAHSYSGAPVVGCFAEFTFLHPLWVTTRRRAPTEVYSSHVAGGAMLIDRGTFRSVGGFRHTVRYVDANILAAVSAAGGSIYRSHGLGYVLRRGAGGHTWDPGLGWFLTAKRSADQWRGFRPSELLSVDEEDRPEPLGDSIPSL